VNRTRRIKSSSLSSHLFHLEDHDGKGVKKHKLSRYKFSEKVEEKVVNSNENVNKVQKNGKQIQGTTMRENYVWLAGEFGIRGIEIAGENKLNI